MYKHDFANVDGGSAEELERAVGTDPDEREGGDGRGEVVHGFLIGDGREDGPHVVADEEEDRDHHA
jgi:hypothetical protein